MPNLVYLGHTRVRQKDHEGNYFRFENYQRTGKTYDIDDENVKYYLDTKLFMKKEDYRKMLEDSKRKALQAKTFMKHI